MQYVDQVLAAGARRSIPAKGVYVYLRESTGDLDIATRHVNTGQGSGLRSVATMRSGDQNRMPSEFDEVEIHNKSGSSVTFTIDIGYNEFSRPLPDEVNVTNTSPLEVEITASNPSAAASSSADSLADLNPTQGAAGKVTVAANANRVRAIITAHPGNADNLRVGDAGVDVANGIPLAPGDSMPWDSTDAINICSEGSTAGQMVSVLELNL